MIDVPLPIALSSIAFAPMEVRVGQTEAIPIPDPIKAGIVKRSCGSRLTLLHIVKNRNEYVISPGMIINLYPLMSTSFPNQTENRLIDAGIIVNNKPASIRVNFQISIINKRIAIQ